MSYVKPPFRQHPLPFSLLHFAIEDQPHSLTFVLNLTESVGRIPSNNGTIRNVSVDKAVGRHNALSTNGDVRSDNALTGNVTAVSNLH
jgi:hypothetical protein